MLEHLRNLRGFFAEVRRVLIPGGRAVVSAMHPAMLLRGSQARFTDPDTGAVMQPGSLPHQLGEFIMAAVTAGFRLDEIHESAPDAEFAARYPRAAKICRLADACPLEAAGLTGSILLAGTVASVTTGHQS